MIRRSPLLSKPRIKKCSVKECRKPFTARSTWARACSPACAEVLAVAERKRLDAKQTRERRAALKTRSDWIAEAQKAFNAFIRERDKNQPCICCGRSETAVQGLYAHGWDCGHYRSRGSAPHLRFDERNAHRQLVYCNRHGAGRAVDYRIGLIARIGIEAVEALEADDAPRKYGIDELKAVRDEYRAKLKALKAAQ